MKRMLVSVVLLFILITPLVVAQGNYAIPWWSIDNGGGVSTGGDYTLIGTLGQADAGLHTGGEYRLDGGYQIPLDRIYDVYLPVIIK